MQRIREHLQAVDSRNPSCLLEQVTFYLFKVKVSRWDFLYYSNGRKDYLQQLSFACLLQSQLSTALSFNFSRSRLAVSSHFVVRSSSFRAIYCSFENILFRPIVNFIVNWCILKESNLDTYTNLESNLASSFQEHSSSSLCYVLDELSTKNSLNLIKTYLEIVIFIVNYCDFSLRLLIHFW